MRSLIGWKAMFYQIIIQGFGLVDTIFRVFTLIKHDFFNQSERGQKPVYTIHSDKTCFLAKQSGKIIQTVFQYRFGVTLRLLFLLVNISLRENLCFGEWMDVPRIFSFHHINLIQKMTLHDIL